MTEPRSSAARRDPAFDGEVEYALCALGDFFGEDALDPVGDPVGAARALAAPGDGALLLRVALPLGAAGASVPGDRDAAVAGRMEGDRDATAAGPSAAPKIYGPPPRDPAWLRIERGSSVVKLAPLRIASGERASGGADAEVLRASRIVVSIERRPCCDTPGCARERTCVAAWLMVHEGPAAQQGAPEARRLLLAEAQDLDEGRAEALVEAVAASAASVLGIPLETSRGAEPPGAIAPRRLPEPLPEPAPALSAAALARFALRTEGELLVLRDHASIGPRASASRNAIVGAVLLAAALGAWIQAARSALAGQRGPAVGVLSMAVLLSLAGYAFVAVARFSMRYTARSAPVAWFGQGRFVVAPWVSRSGAVELRPEGRLGAAISIGELHGVEVRARDGSFAIELDTDHGPIDALTTESEEVALYWRDALARAAASMRHPGGPSARQRLRARAQAQVAAG